MSRGAGRTARWEDVPPLAKSVAMSTPSLRNRLVPGVQPPKMKSDPSTVVEVGLSARWESRNVNDAVDRGRQCEGRRLRLAPIQCEDQPCGAQDESKRHASDRDRTFAGPACHSFTVSGPGRRDRSASPTTTHDRGDRMQLWTAEMDAMRDEAKKAVDASLGPIREAMGAGNEAPGTSTRERAGGSRPRGDGEHLLPGRRRGGA